MTTERIVFGGTTSEYYTNTNTIKLVYWGRFDSFINDLDHEILHSILYQLEGEQACHQLDNTILQLEFAVGFKNYKEFTKWLFVLNQSRLFKAKIHSIVRRIEALEQKHF